MADPHRPQPDYHKGLHRMNHVVQSQSKSVQLIELAHGRSGDKGDTVSIGVIARRPQYFELLREVVTVDVVRSVFRSLCSGEIVRYELPNLLALNFVLQNGLDGGGTVSLRSDAQGKTYIAALLRASVDVPAHFELGKGNGSD